jgi:hypothetical protein
MIQRIEGSASISFYFIPAEIFSVVSPSQCALSAPATKHKSSDSYSLFRPDGCALRRQSQPSVTARGKHSLLKSKTKTTKEAKTMEKRTQTQRERPDIPTWFSFTRGSCQQARPDHEGIQRILDLQRRKSNPRAHSMPIAFYGISGLDQLAQPVRSVDNGLSQNAVAITFHHNRG